jgi:nitroreductase
MDVLIAIEQRTSVRGYADRPVEEHLLQRLLASAHALSNGADHLTDAPPRIVLISGVEQVRRVLTFVVGSYGLIQNPPHLLVGVLPEASDLARLDLGYVLEQVVLEATGLGLGTVWVAGSFDPRRAGAAVGLAPGEVVAAVCPLGYAAESGLRRFHSQVVHRLAGGHRRKPLSEIVFEQRWGLPWSPEGADPRLVTVLEHARLAPSAVNRQPWRFIVLEKDLVLALVQQAPIDAGIVMAHAVLAAAAEGYTGRWQVRLRNAALALECGLPARASAVGVFPLG